MPVAFTTLPNDIRVPFFYAEVDPSKANSSGRRTRTLVVGPKLAAGTALVNAQLLCTSNGQANTYAGRGSILARMVDAYRRNDDFGEMWILPVSDPGAGVAATKTATVTGPATAAGTIPLYVAGQLVQIAVASGDTATAIAAAIAAAVQAGADLPYTAAAADAVATLTCKHKGLIGNDIDVRTAYRGPSGGESLPAGVTVTIAAGVAGAGSPDLAAALAALGDEEFDHIVMPWTDATSLDAFRDEMNDVTGRWSPLRMIYGHVYTAKVAAHATLVTLGGQRNDPHTSIVGLADTPTPSYEIAAAFAGRAARSLGNHPSIPLRTLKLIGVLAPPPDSRFTIQERNILYWGGISSAVTVAGEVMIDRAITTFRVNVHGQPDNGMLNVTRMFQISYTVRYLRQEAERTMSRSILADDGTAFGAGLPIVTPKIIRGGQIAAYGDLIELGIAENMEAFKKYLIVERDPNNSERVNTLFAPDYVNELNTVALLLQFRDQYSAAELA